MPIIAQNFNINNLRTTKAKSIDLHTIRKLIKYSLKKISQSIISWYGYLIYCCRKIGQYYHLQIEGQGATGLKLSEKPKNYLEFVEISSKMIDLQA